MYTSRHTVYKYLLLGYIKSMSVRKTMFMEVFVLVDNHYVKLLSVPKLAISNSSMVFSGPKTDSN